MRNRRIVAASVTIGLALLCAVLPVAGKDSENFRSIKLNTDALTYAKKLICEGHVVVDRKGAWAKDRPSTNSRMSLSVCTDSVNMQNGISELTIATPRTPKGDTNFPMATSKMFIAAGCLLRKLEQASTGIPKSKMPRPS